MECVWAEYWDTPCVLDQLSWEDGLLPLGYQSGLLHWSVIFKIQFNRKDWMSSVLSLFLFRCLQYYYYYYYYPMT